MGGKNVRRKGGVEKITTAFQEEKYRLSQSASRIFNEVIRTGAKKDRRTGVNGSKGRRDDSEIGRAISTVESR